MRSIAAGMSPAKIAMAVAVTMAPRAGTGGMKNVTGTSNAVAMVAVKPGIAPTKMPNADDARITHRTNGSKTSLVAAIRTSMRPSQDRVQDGWNGPNAQPDEQCQQEHKRDRNEANRVRSKDIDKQQSQSQKKTRYPPGIARPWRELEPWRAGAPRGKSIPHERSAAQDEARAENAWKQ